MLTPNSDVPAEQNALTVYVESAASTTGFCSVTVEANEPPGLAGKLCWNACVGKVPGPPVLNSVRLLISMIGWPWYAALIWKMIEPTGIGSGAQMRAPCAPGGMAG